MKKISWSELTLKGTLVAIAAVGPTAFPAAQAGYNSLHDLAFRAILPAAILLVIAWTLLRKSPYPDVAASIHNGALAGALATIALEAVRYSGFRLGFMPGNLPELMGVLLFNSFALGPTTASTLAGFTYHFWNGACFGIVFALGRFRLPNWWAIPYGIAVGVGFLVSPVVQGLGVGLFGVDFGWHFAATVLAAHLAFGAAMAWLLSKNWTEELPDRGECKAFVSCHGAPKHRKQLTPGRNGVSEQAASPASSRHSVGRSPRHLTGNALPADVPTPPRARMLSGTASTIGGISRRVLSGL